MGSSRPSAAFSKMLLCFCSVSHYHGGRLCALWTYTEPTVFQTRTRSGKTNALCSRVNLAADAAASYRTRIAGPLRKAAMSGALSEVQWLLSLVPSGPVLEALKSLALAQAAVSMSGSTCKWLLGNGANGNIYVTKGDLKEALVAHVYRQDGHTDSAR